MTMFKQAAIALSLAAAVGAVATPSFAQTTRAERMEAAREARAQAQAQYDVRWLPAQQQRLGYGAYAYAWQYPQNPNECIVDEGYGRTSPCSY